MNTPAREHARVIGYDTLMAKGARARTHPTQKRNGPTREPSLVSNPSQESREAIAEFGASLKKQPSLLRASTDKKHGYVTTNYKLAMREKHTATAKDFLRQEQVLKVLEKTSQYLAVETNINSILEKIAETIAVALGAKQLTFWDFTPDHKGAFITAAYGMQQQYIDHSRKDPLPIGGAWLGRAMQTGQAWATSDIQKDPLLPKSWLPAVKKQAYHGLLCVPIMRKNEIIGGMCIYHKDRHEYQFFELDIMTIVSNQVATALENARIFADLNAERDKTLATIRSLADGLIMYDPDGKVTLMNPRAQELLWLDASEVMGKIIAPERAKKSVYIKNLLSIRQLDLADYEPKEFVSEGPQKLALQVTRVPVRDQKKQIIGTMYILHDTTREKEVELLKSGFISTASHQLRTPLTGIRWSLARISEGEAGDLNAEQKKLLQETYRTTEHMVGLVNDLLDAARIEEGRYGYEFIRADLASAVAKVVENLSANAKGREIVFALEEPKNPLPHVSIDTAKIDIAIQNVVDNALKYTKPGGKVTISFQTDPNALSIVVSDTGIGIPVSAHKFIFQKFFRAENAQRFQTEGSGLGLYIARNIIEKHNGAITFTSSEGNGATFFIRLPLDPKKMPKGVIKGI